jgi:serine/threonine protein kinase
VICINCGTQFSPPSGCPECHWDVSVALDPGAVCQSGDILDNRYTVVRFLGQGRFGMSFLAKDSRRDVDVVLKFIPPTFLPTPPHFKRFSDGISMLIKNSLPRSAVRLLDIGQLKGGAFVCTEFAGRDTLADLIAQRKKRGTPFTMREIYPIIKEIVSALVEHPVQFHGALTPNNVFIQSGSIKVTNCGLLANLPETVVALRLTANSGRIQYIAPELPGSEFEGPGARSDVYSLGAILAELLTLESYDGHLGGLESLADSHAEITSILQHAVARTPSERFRDAEQLLIRLSTIAGFPTPRFSRSWADGENSASGDDSTEQEEKTAQIVMKDVIQQHYEEITSVGSNPLQKCSEPDPVGATPAASELQPPLSQQNGRSENMSIPKPSPMSGIPLPSKGNVKTTDSRKHRLPVPGRSVAPVRPVSPGSIPLPRPSSLIPAPPGGTSSTGNADVLHDGRTGDASAKMPTVKSSDPLLDEDSIASLDALYIDADSEPPMLSDNAILEDIDDEELVSSPDGSPDDTDVEQTVNQRSPLLSSAPPAIATDQQPENDEGEAVSLDETPTDGLSAQRKPTASPPPANNDEDKAAHLEGINPRFLRAAKTLKEQQSRNLGIPEAPLESPFDTSRDSDEWRNRLEQELASNEESMISFLPDASDQMVIPAVDSELPSEAHHPEETEGTTSLHTADGSRAAPPDAGHSGAAGEADRIQESEPSNTAASDDKVGLLPSTPAANVALPVPPAPPIPAPPRVAGTPASPGRTAVPPPPPPPPVRKH